MLPLVSNGSANLSFKIRRNGIHLVYCASVVPDLAHYLGLIPATNFPIAVHADVPAGVRLRHANLLWKTGCYDGR
jgi:hypothetical protein